MARKNKRAKVRDAMIPAVELIGPTPEQRIHATYVQDDIIHAESFTRATVHRIRQVSSLRKMVDDGQLDESHYYAAMQIAFVAEMIERNVAVQCASLEARVDYAGSGRDALVERLGTVRMEMAYTMWRTMIPAPRRMIVDMVIADRALFATARAYGVGWPRAKRLLCDGLSLWSEIIARVARLIEQDDLDKAHRRIGA